MPAGSNKQAAGERRRWVRLLAACNNHCRFCLDRFSLDGSLRSRDEIMAELRAGRDEGAVRAVLSGGEPTLHPELAGLIREARAMGYRWVQIITNGRRLSYAPFLGALIGAGLDEITISLHGSSPSVHDDLVGIPGAFEQAFAGLQGALRAGLVVSVDIVLNRRNLADAPALIRRTLAAGVREYDILWLTPFGGAAEHLASPRGLFLGPADAPALHRVLDQAREGGAVVWTNRVPIAYLEGYEHLAQDPSKLEDELRGRRPLLDKLVRDGGSLECRDRRCPRCPFDAFCDLLHRAVAVSRGERPAPVLRWDPASPEHATALARFSRPTTAWLRAKAPVGPWRRESRDAALGAAHLRVEGSAPVLAASLADLPRRASLHVRFERPVRALPRALVRSPHDLILPLTKRLARVLDPSSLHGGPGAVVVALPDADEGAAGGWPLLADSGSEMRRWLRAATLAEDLPVCLAPGLPIRPRPRPFDLGWLDAEGRVEPMAVLRDFLLEGNSAMSFRCAVCTARRSCRGIPWRMARDMGLSVLRPIRRA